jgi:hypothetical protein
MKDIPPCFIYNIILLLFFFHINPFEFERNSALTDCLMQK